jgi:hypothetical protein
MKILKHITKLLYISIILLSLSVSILTILKLPNETNIISNMVTSTFFILTGSFLISILETFFKYLDRIYK